MATQFENGGDDAAAPLIVSDILPSTNGTRESTDPLAPIAPNLQSPPAQSSTSPPSASSGALPQEDKMQAEPQSGQNTGLSVASLSSHLRIQSLERQWKKQHHEQQQHEKSDPVFVSSDSSDSSTDTDIPAVAPQVSAKETAVPVPLFQKPLPPAIKPSVSSPTKLPSGAVCLTQTPVPVPKIPSMNSSASSSTPEEKAVNNEEMQHSMIKQQARRLTQESVMKHYEKALLDNEASQRSQSTAPQSTAPQSTTPVQAAVESTSKRPDSSQDGNPLRFTTGTELVARARLLTRGQFAAKHSPNVNRGRNDGASKAPANPSTDSIGIAYTIDGRPYNMVPVEGGKEQPSYGAIIPTNYQILSNPRRVPCPVRGCNRPFDSVASLGGHFNSKHCNGQFNDNCDGTISLMKVYKNLKDRSPGIVVSQDPNLADKPPVLSIASPLEAVSHGRVDSRTGSPVPTVRRSSSMLEPNRTVPDSYYSKETIRTRVLQNPHKVSTNAAVRANAALRTSSLSDVCKYLHSFLAPTQKMPQREDVAYMARLPRLRDLPASWISRHTGEMLPVPQYSAALAFIVGDFVKGQGECSRYHLSRLSMCVALPSSMPRDIKRCFYKLPTCVGCFYTSYSQRQRNLCDWTRRSEEPFAEDVNNSSVSAISETQQVAPAEPLPDQTRVRKRRRVMTEEETVPAVKAPRMTEKDDRSESGPYKMEDWEMAPGLITGKDGANKSFSGAYLRGDKPVLIHPDVSVNVLVIQFGDMKRWEALPDAMRICTVAAGKVKVKMGEDEWMLGLNGGFAVAPGETCLVKNPFYSDATIHCTTVHDYSLQEG